MINNNENKNPLEIERKFLIRYPDVELLDILCFSKSQITQTYLINTDRESSSRIRMRNYNGRLEYTKTEKKRVSDMTRIENEENISVEEYDRLLKSADPALNTIYKTRWCVSYNGLIFEIDAFPFWKDRAALEIELESEEQEIRLPEYIDVIKEVTSDRRYTNRALAREVPYDDIDY
jgi:CYTH domain-containing protein